MYATMLIAVPTGVKVFNWVATMWKGAMTFETPMLFAIAFVISVHDRRLVRFDAGDRTRVDFQYHDTYFVVAHFPLCHLCPGHVFSASSAAVYYWLPKWTGNMYDEALGKLHFWLSTSSVSQCAVLPAMHFVGLAGMPRRVPDYNVQFADWTHNGVSLGRCIVYSA